MFAVFSGFDRASAFRIGSAAFLIAAVYHLAALLIPVFGAMLYPPGYPALRHLAFIAINIAFSRLFLSRPKWFVLVYGLLTIQVILGHGMGAWYLWREQQRAEWTSVIVVTATVAGFFLLLVDAGANRSRRTHGAHWS
jgi:hypothetical protein